MNKPAFPVVSNGGIHEHQVFDEGMTLRDWFAGQALASIAETYANKAVDPNVTAKSAYQFADAMLAARDAPLPEPPQERADETI